MSGDLAGSPLPLIASDEPPSPLPVSSGPRLPFHSGASLLEIAERENVRLAQFRTARPVTTRVSTVAR